MTRSMPATSYMATIVNITIQANRPFLFLIASPERGEGGGGGGEEEGTT